MSTLLDLFNTGTCLCLSLVWLQLSLVNMLLDYLKTTVPLSLVRQRQLDETEETMQGECTLGAISVWMLFS
ncbi:uncharacterized protein Dwil_GK27436 [Drosophila willistoni]|uniref:Uncharacterized protein n=1 Tax=Drosophila willistoni TaxID=7260 RepID=A0A0Q9X2F7_DROWI|nr:uncharacterized protein LOC26529438 [Drosophila willistoni]KRF99297.1 uncharacterized protein Dwil_GK27436 [Drosophila willistoni]